jgi:hypothetical protein
MKPTRAPGLAQDTRGAVMFIGLFMACFLAGGLWSLFGIGSAIMHREIAQEAVDSSAFSSAVMHAKGMNAIAVMNLLMLVTTSLYVIMSLVVDVLLIAASVSGGSTLNLAKSVDRIAGIYMTGAKPLMTSMAHAQTALIRTTPRAAESVAAQVGTEYKVKVVSSPLSPVNLPATSTHMSTLCANAVHYVIGPVKALYLKYFARAGGVAAGFLALLNDTVAPLVEEVHCSGPSGGADNSLFARYLRKAVRALGQGFYVYKQDAFWGNEAVGPKTLRNGAENGSVQMKIRVSTSDALDDSSSRKKVTLLNAISSKLIPEVAAAPTPTYLGDAEFYWDCAQGWNHEECNGDKEEFPVALYGMRWRGRLIQGGGPGPGPGGAGTGNSNNGGKVATKPPASAPSGGSGGGGAAGGGASSDPKDLPPGAKDLAKAGAKSVGNHEADKLVDKGLGGGPTEKGLRRAGTLAGLGLTVAEEGVDDKTKLGLTLLKEVAVEKATDIAVRKAAETAAGKVTGRIVGRVATKIVVGLGGAAIGAAGAPLILGGLAVGAVVDYVAGDYISDGIGWLRSKLP